MTAKKNNTSLTESREAITFITGETHQNLTYIGDIQIQEDAIYLDGATLATLEDDGTWRLAARAGQHFDLRVTIAEEASL